MTNQPGEFSIEQQWDYGEFRLRACSHLQPKTAEPALTGNWFKIYLPNCSQIPRLLNHGFYFLSNEMFKYKHSYCKVVGPGALLKRPG